MHAFPKWFDFLFFILVNPIAWLVILGLLIAGGVYIYRLYHKHDNQDDVPTVLNKD